MRYWAVTIVSEFPLPSSICVEPVVFVQSPKNALISDNLRQRRGNDLGIKICDFESSDSPFSELNTPQL